MILRVKIDFYSKLEFKGLSLQGLRMLVNIDFDLPCRDDAITWKNIVAERRNSSKADYMRKFIPLSRDGIFRRDPISIVFFIKKHISDLIMFDVETKSYFCRRKIL